MNYGWQSLLPEQLPSVAKVQAGNLTVGAAPTLMGVVNLSPDSWYRESVCLDAESAVQRGRTLVAQGAAIVDVGAESTVPGTAAVQDADKVKRLLPVIEGLVASEVVVSVEVDSLQVAEAALAAGAQVLNIVGGPVTDLLTLGQAADAASILAYYPGRTPRANADRPEVDTPIDAVIADVASVITPQLTAGNCNIIVDPGMGFYYANLPDGPERVAYQTKALLSSWRLSHEFGLPVCNALPHAFSQFREEVRSAEGYFAVLAVLGGTQLLRTHEVARVAGVVRTMAAGGLSVS